MSKRPSARKRGYDKIHERDRARFLERNPWCRYCLQLDKHVRATVLDHIIPHRGDRRLLRDKSNWQGLCRSCHNSVKQSQERSGYLKGSDAMGNPLDPDDPWYGG